LLTENTCKFAPMKIIERIGISAADRERLERLVRDRNTPQKVVWRARIVLLASDGLTAEGIAAAVDKSLLTVRRWRRRIVAKGMDGLLKDATRPSRVKPLAPEKIKQVVHMTLHAKPPNASHWSLRSMAAAAGLSYSSVQRTWRAHGLSEGDGPASCAPRPSPVQRHRSIRALGTWSSWRMAVDVARAVNQTLSRALDAVIISFDKLPQ
jgi:transposase